MRDMTDMYAVTLKGAVPKYISQIPSKSCVITTIPYHIAENCGGGKLRQIWQIECHLPIF